MLPGLNTDLLLVAILLAAITASSAAESDEDFKTIFDGRSLAGWETPDPTYWSVEEGAITARITKDHPCSVNQYLVWRGGELADFELKLKSRVNGEGAINNGFQFRSRLLPDHNICGYQVDNNLQTSWLVRLYDEFGRHTLAWRGERAAFDADGHHAVTSITNAQGDSWFRLEDWHEYHLTCVGSNLKVSVNGRLAAEVEDHDPRRRELQGVLALQLHSGPATVAQFKDIRLRILKPVEVKPKAVPSPSEEKRLALQRQAVAWWPLDTGGHGARPPLRHIPDWEKFELNVRATGEGARPDSDVVLLHGAYFDAGTSLHGGDNDLTVYLRARDPQGAWNAALFGKGGGPDRVHFNLFSADLPQTPGPDIAFEIRTDRGPALVSFSVSRIAPKAWHDLVGRYDGKTLDIFCDGQHMAGKPCRGALVKNREPLLIAAEINEGKVVRYFEGELQEAALWSRALSAEEISALSK
jgi:hypothetical protein